MRTDDPLMSLLVNHGVFPTDQKRREELHKILTAYVLTKIDDYAIIHTDRNLSQDMSEIQFAGVMNPWDRGRRENV